MPKRLLYETAVKTLNKAGEVIEKHTTNEEAEKRWGICKTCEHFRPYNRTCEICGCALKLKVQFKALHCPDNPPRW